MRVFFIFLWAKQIQNFVHFVSIKSISIKVRKLSISTLKYIFLRKNRLNELYKSVSLLICTLRSDFEDDRKVHCKPIPVMKTGFSQCSFSHREKPVFITWEPCNENRFFPVWKNYTGKTLFWPCTGPVRDCSVALQPEKWWFIV